MINPKDVAGCGNPVCVLVDSIPRRFPSLCSFLTYLSSFERVRQFYFVQKGDCADASELIQISTSEQVVEPHFSFS